MCFVKEHGNSRQRIGWRNVGPRDSAIGAAIDAFRAAVNEGRGVKCADHGNAIGLGEEVERETFPVRSAVLGHIDFAGRSRFVFSSDDGFWNAGCPIDRAEIPVATESLETLPGVSVCRPTRGAIQRKAGDARGIILIHARGPTGFVSAGNCFIIDALPVLTLIGTAPETEANDLDRHVAILSICHHAGTAARPRSLDGVVGKSKEWSRSPSP